MRRLPARQLEVGSIPTGVSFKQGFDVVGPAAHRSIVHDLDRCVPNMESDEAMSPAVSSEAEHQAVNLEVTGSTPVPTTTSVGW